MSDALPQIALIPYTTPDIRMVVINKAEVSLQASSASRMHGRRPHPVSFSSLSQLMFAVDTHHVCLHTKRDTTVGLGFESKADREAREKKKEEAQMPIPAAGEKPVAKKEGGVLSPSQSKICKTLDPLCDYGFQTLINTVGEDYENCANGYIEVVRGLDGQIERLWHLPAAAVFVFQEGDTGYSHFEADDASGRSIKFARFGDVDGLIKRLDLDVTDDARPRELIHFKAPSAQSPYYGLPTWLGVVPWLELAQQALQFQFDYYQNRAVPDLVALFMGRSMDPKLFNELKESFKQTIGGGKRFRSIVANIPDPEMKVLIQHLQEAQREALADVWPTIVNQIVSAHHVPPLLAGIQTPGKMSAANELPSALLAFQSLYVDQHQRIFQDTLWRTLCSPEAGLGLGPDDCLLRRVTDQFDMGQVDTMSRMRQPSPTATAQGRKLKDGLKD